MTILACGRFNGFNLLIADAMVGTQDGFTSHRECRLAEKVTYWPDTDTYVGLVGDDTILRALDALVFWSTYKARPINLESLNDMEILVETANRMRIARETANPGMPSPQGSIIFFANSQSVYYWVLNYDPSHGGFFFSHRDPLQPKKGLVEICYSGTKVLKQAKVTFESASEIVIGLLEAEHISQKAAGKGLSYEFDGRYSGVVIPHDPSKKSILIQPYRSLSDRIYGYDGGTNNWKMIENPAFNWSPF